MFMSHYATEVCKCPPERHHQGEQEVHRLAVNLTEALDIAEGVEGNRLALLKGVIGAILAAGFFLDDVAKCPVRVADVNQEAMLPSYIAGAQVFVHEKRLAGTGRAQQEHVVVLYETGIQGLFLNVETLRDQSDSVAHFEHAIDNACVESVKEIQA